MIFRLSCAAATMLAIAAPLRAAPHQEATAAFDAAATHYETALAREQVVGSAVALVGPDGVIATRNYGLADKGMAQPVDDETLFHWASVTKVFTSIAAMQLVEDGRLSLDDPVAKYIPAFRQVRDPFGSVDEITIRHLLTHSSGLRGPTWPWNADGAEDRADWQPLEPTRWSQIEAMFPYTAIAFEPGSRASYSNLGLSLLGRVVEVVTNDDIETYINKNILMPLGMTHTYFDATPWYLRPHRTHGYRVTASGIQDQGTELDTGATHANGGLNGPVSDMAKFVAWLLAPKADHAILKPETLDAMLQPQLLFEKDDRRTVWIGLGFFVADEKDVQNRTHRYFGHSGYQIAHRGALYISADGCCGFIFAANTVTHGGNPSASALRIALIDTVFPALRTDEEGPRK